MTVFVSAVAGSSDVAGNCHDCLPIASYESQWHEKKIEQASDNHKKETGVSRRSMQERFGVPSFYYTLAIVGQLGFDVDGRTTEEKVTIPQGKQGFFTVACEEM